MIEYYQDFTVARDGIEYCAAPLPYRWLDVPNCYDLSKTHGMAQYLWFEIADFQARDIANSINELTIHARNFDAWQKILQGLERDEAFRVHHEFIRSNSIVALNLPYSIKSRFYYAISHLSHQANRVLHAENWQESHLPLDRDINQEIAAKISKGWKGWRKVASRLDRCDTGTFREGTLNFRNSYTHRHDVIIGLEATPPIKREATSTPNKTSYIVGGTKIMELSIISQLIKVEFDNFSRAYSAFQNLINEQKDALSTLEQPM
ncbi:hypothetical protein [Pararhodobacter oceanensis]|uniref:hypothetical protein n=1 Tax=Pararhodobacter oceanensis TaxID=2172121 RepID=UPI003A93965E